MAVERAQRHLEPRLARARPHVPEGPQGERGALIERRGDQVLEGALRGGHALLAARQGLAHRAGGVEDDVDRAGDRPPGLHHGQRAGAGRRHVGRLEGHGVALQPTKEARGAREGGVEVADPCRHRVGPAVHGGPGLHQVLGPVAAARADLEREHPRPHRLQGLPQAQGERLAVRLGVGHQQHGLRTSAVRKGLDRRDERQLGVRGVGRAVELGDRALHARRVARPDRQQPARRRGVEGQELHRLALGVDAGRERGQRAVDDRHVGRHRAGRVPGEHHGALGLLQRQEVRARLDERLQHHRVAVLGGERVHRPPVRGGEAVGVADGGVALEAQRQVVVTLRHGDLVPVDVGPHRHRARDRAAGD